LTDQEWFEKLDTALMAMRPDDLRHGTNAAYVHGCVCNECREHQRVRMAKNRSLEQRVSQPRPDGCLGAELYGHGPSELAPASKAQVSIGRRARVGRLAAKRCIRQTPGEQR
jgi:hypothetical protein